LRGLGLVVSIDDFGAGFTSLAYLSNLAVGELKLDRTIVAGLASSEGERDYELVRSTIALGHALGLRVVAEGIEDRGTLEVLSSLGCDLAQGYFISKPKAATDFAFRSQPPAPPPAPGTDLWSADDWLRDSRGPPCRPLEEGAREERSPVGDRTP
jgi:EAL domain-containing protein (putative c-di-GMP-specific phosphodiesterase class I)